MGQVIADACVACNAPPLACDATVHTMGTACCVCCSHPETGSRPTTDPLDHRTTTLEAAPGEFERPR